MKRPHVVILGAGASRAVCPHGDALGRKLPLMNDFVDALGLRKTLTTWGLDPDQNFEDIFSTLYEQGRTTEIDHIQSTVEEYFSQLELPVLPTIYDHLVLSLRDKDLIATFNWDPLLVQAYVRNQGGVTLPRLAFLHGNVAVGYCEQDKVKGNAGGHCPKCGESFRRTPLLYPIKTKNYAADNFIAAEWDVLRRELEQAFMITVFGYSGPKSDEEAIAAMSAAWGDPSVRAMEQTAFVTIQGEDEVTANWERFIHSHHYEIESDFYETWIANHPRRTGEAYLSQYVDAKFIENNPIPRGLDFPELWSWYEKLRLAEVAPR